MAGGNNSIKMVSSAPKLSPLEFEVYEDLKDGRNPKKKGSFKLLKVDADGDMTVKK